jgi:ABC-type sugar transport system substrate-binding protein
MTRTARVVGGIAVLAVVLSACSSSKTGSSGGSSSGKSSASAAASGSAGSGVGAAKSYLDSVSGNPTGIGIDAALSKTPPTGKYIINLTTGEPVAKIKSDAEAAAAKALGWKYESISIGSTAEAPHDAMESAISKKPDGISFSGAPSAAFGTAIADAKAANIPLLGDTITETAVSPLISSSLDDATQVANWGKMVAAQFVVDSKGKGKAAVFTINQYPVLVAWQDAVKKNVAAWCPSCSLKLVNVAATDIGTKLPQQVVSSFQSDPTLGYALFSTGDETLGLNAALSAASLTKVKVMGETPNEGNIQALKDKKELGWTGFPTIILGWRIMDMWARHFDGDSLDVANKALLPLQMLTADNIGSAKLTATGNYYVGYPDYQTAFKKLWKLSGA